MAEHLSRLPDAELTVMQALWAAGGEATRPELERLLADQHWARSTLLSLLARLEKRGCIEKVPQGKGLLFRALIQKDAYLQAESQSVLHRAFGGSAKQFIAALYAGESLSAQDIHELEDYLHALQKGE